jgi:hypothetical protein
VPNNSYEITPIKEVLFPESSCILQIKNMDQVLNAVKLCIEEIKYRNRPAGYIVINVQNTA